MVGDVVAERRADARVVTRAVQHRRRVFLLLVAVGWALRVACVRAGCSRLAGRRAAGFVPHRGRARAGGGAGGALRGSGAARHVSARGHGGDLRVALVVGAAAEEAIRVEGVARTHGQLALEAHGGRLHHHLRGETNTHGWVWFTSPGLYVNRHSTQPSCESARDH